MLQPMGHDLLSFFLVFVVLPLVTYFLLGKCNGTTKKKERIHLIAQRAAEDIPSDNSMAIGNFIPEVQLPNNAIRHCAKCLGPAGTRCSQCKSVWYCSGRCQIVHWRQIHKFECQQMKQIEFVPSEKHSDITHYGADDLRVISSEQREIGNGNINGLLSLSSRVDGTISHDIRMESINQVCSSPERTMTGKSRIISRSHENHLLKSVKSKEKVAKFSSEPMKDEINIQGSNSLTNMGIMRLMGVKISSKTSHLRYSEDKVNGQRKTKNCQMLFPYEEFVKCFQYKVLNMIPRGLLNCGNSCYANAVLQCLTCTKPLIVYLLRHSHSKSGCAKDHCIMCELELLIMKKKESCGPLSPMNILMLIRSLNSHIGHGSQEDAHEFLRLLVASMQSICLEGIGGVNIVDPRLQDSTFVQHLFGGRLRSKVKCLRCNHESERYENMMDLTLEISGWVESLEDALTQFTSPEELDGENMYRCSRCAAHVRARKQLSIQEAPNILTVVLKRFQEGNYGKINKFITFPEMLNMIPYMSGSDDVPSVYILYGVVVHLDTSNASFSGHYISYVKDLVGNWFCVDDSEVQSVDSSQVMSQRQGAYILFYMRSSPRPVASVDSKTTCAIANSTYLPGEWGEPDSNIYEGHHQPLDHRLETRYAEFSDASWPLFTSSDDSSFTTESTRDSFSTVDQTDAPFSSIFQSLYPAALSTGRTASCNVYSCGNTRTRFARKEAGLSGGNGGYNQSRVHFAMS